VEINQPKSNEMRTLIKQWCKLARGVKVKKAYNKRATDAVCDSATVKAI